MHSGAVAGLLKLQDYSAKCIIIGLTSNIRKNKQPFLDSGAHAVWSKPLPSGSKLLHQLQKLLFEHYNHICVSKMLKGLEDNNHMLHFSLAALNKYHKVNTVI